MLHKTYNFSDSGIGLMELFKDEPYLFLLDSSDLGLARSRYSFIGFDPFLVIKNKGKDSLASVKKEFFKFYSSAPHAGLPLTSGMVGFLSYDYGLYQEKIQLKAKDDLALPDCCFGFYDCILTIDHKEKKLHVTSSGLPEENDSLRQKRATQRLKDITQKLSRYVKPVMPHGSTDIHRELFFKANMSKEEYAAKIRQALEHIRLGNIYQVNLSQRFELDGFECGFDHLETYKRLRQLSPSSFGGYFNAGDFQITSSSPERFLSLQGRKVETVPMKGTRPRGKELFLDKKLREEIVESAKDKAELLMITDLERNDLGKVCEYGSIKVSDMRSIEEYRNVFQATSTVQGTLKNDKNCFDLLEACFPGGSVTGCPKIRAMEIIEELEPTRRGPYTGSLGYMSFAGDMDFNILIRTLLTIKNKFYFHVGSGIVADSIPESEYQETLVKAASLKEALEQSLAAAQPFQKI